MYQALYRKYRPTNFENVVGQETIVKTLKNEIINNKLSHAYLFTGPRGTGKTSIAKIFAKTINCLDHENGVPCEKCVICTQINNKQFTDIIEIDAASNNGVDEIREIRNKVSLVPGEGKYKVYIIDEVHMLTTGAFNALLKTLEEPPAHIIFILATTEPHKIPETILSRCQRFDFKRIADTSIVERLKCICNEEKITISDEALYEIAQISNGGMRDSISLLDQVNAYKNSDITVEDVHQVNGSLSKKELDKFISYIFDKDIENILKALDQYDNSGKNIIKVVEEITKKLKDNLYDSITSNNNKYSVTDITEILDSINNNLINIKQANDARLAIELMFIKMCYKNKQEEVKPVKEVTVKKTVTIEKDNKAETIKVEEVKKEPVKVVTNKDNSNLLERIVERRIDNTLARFKKSEFKNIKESIKQLNDYVTDPEFGRYSSLLMDGELKAASDEYLLFVYDTENSSKTFNNELYDIENFVAKILQQKYKVISVPKISWEIIKKNFNSKNREFLYLPEDFDVRMINDAGAETFDNIFNNIIEYE